MPRPFSGTAPAQSNWRTRCNTRSFRPVSGICRALPIVIPPFVQYQAPLVPLRGLWNHAPPEGDKFVSAEINWGTTTNNLSAVQFSISGNSPVAISQIAAISVDNSRNGGDIAFLFPDSGSELTVPAYTQGIYPVFTNALMFYVVSPGAIVGDTTIFAVHNSVPPPLAMQSSQTQEAAAISGFDLHTNGTFPLLTSTIGGTVEAIAGNVIASGAGSAGVDIRDGTGKVIWSGNSADTAGVATNMSYSTGPIRVRFRQGLNIVIYSSTYPVAAALFTANVYYGVP